MKTRICVRGPASVILLIVVTSVAWAAPQAQDEGAERPGLAPLEVQRLLDAYVLVQAQEALGLSESQYPQFVVKLRALQEARRRNEQARLRLIVELNRLSLDRTAAEGREPEIRQRLKALDELEISATAELRKAREELIQTLDIRQQARLRVFEERIERQKLELLQRTRLQRQQQRQPQRQSRPQNP
jgi:hypothetical protein